MTKTKSPAAKTLRRCPFCRGTGHKTMFDGQYFYQCKDLRCCYQRMYFCARSKSGMAKEVRMKDSVSLAAEVEAIRKRCEAASSGPWKVCGASKGRCSCGIVFGSNGEAYLCCMTTVDEADPAYVDEQRKNNAYFIAHTRTDIPRLLALYDQQREEIARVRREVFDECIAIAKQFTLEAKSSLITLRAQHNTATDIAELIEAARDRSDEAEA